MKYRLLFLTFLFLGGTITGRAQLRLADMLARIDEHPRVVSAQAKVDMYHGRKLQGWSPSSPALTFHEEEIPRAGSLGTGALREWQVSQEFDLPLLIGARGGMDAHLQRASEQQISVVRMEVRASLIASYAAWYASWQQLTLQKENTTLTEEFARKAALRHTEGESSALESSRARAEAATSRVALAQAELALRDAARRLYEAGGGLFDLGSIRAQSPADSLRPLDLPALLAKVRDGAAAAPDAESSPMLARLREQRDAMRANASWRWMEFLPRFEIAYIEQDFADIGRHWGAELTASIPLWFLLDTRGSIEEHQAVRRMAEEEYTLGRLRLHTQREHVRENLQTALTHFQAYENELRSEATVIAAAAESGYANGEIGYMEYIDGRRSANEIRLGYYDALAAVYAAIARYEQYYNEYVLD
ncbi:TolC family protein [bacterium]|nr:TolC family protein [bacterium]